MRPFSREYVLATTVSHMQKCVDNSIRKTFDRVPDFMNDEVKSKEVFITLANLHAMKKDVNNLVKGGTPSVDVSSKDEK